MKQHSPRFLSLVAAAKTAVTEITPQSLREKVVKKESFYLIDVREASEWQEGHLPDAVHLSKGLIERDIEKLIADPQARIVVYCSGGFRSTLVADNLQKMGYLNVLSLAGGASAWFESGYEKIKD